MNILNALIDQFVYQFIPFYIFDKECMYLISLIFHPLLYKQYITIKFIFIYFIIYMEYLEKNCVVFDNSNTKYNYELGKVKNTTDDLYQVFGLPIKKNNIHFWKFEANNSKFKIYNKKESKFWYLSSNTNDELKKKYFLAFLSEARKTVDDSIAKT